MTGSHLLNIRLLDLSGGEDKDLSSVVGYALSVNNNLTNDRRFVGSNLIKKPQRSEKRKVTGRIVVESGDEVLEAFTLFKQGARHRYQLYFQGDDIDSYVTYSMEIQTHRTELRGSLPNVVSMGRQHIDVPFDCYEWGITPEEPHWDCEGFIILTNDRPNILDLDSNSGTPDSDPEA